MLKKPYVTWVIWGLHAEGAWHLLMGTILDMGYLLGATRGRQWERWPLGLLCLGLALGLLMLRDIFFLDEEPRYE